MIKTMLFSSLLFLCAISANFHYIYSYISPLHNRRVVHAPNSYMRLKSRFVPCQRARFSTYRYSNSNSDDGFTDDIFDDFQSTASVSIPNNDLGSTATADITEVPEIDIMKAFNERNTVSGELALLSENSAENPNAGDGVMSASDNDISEISNPIEERIPAYALLYRFEQGFTIDDNPLVQDHEEFCDDFDTLINSELLSLNEDQKGAVLLWGSFNSTAEGKLATMQEIRRFQKNDPLNDMLEEFEIIDMSPHIPAAVSGTPGEREMVENQRDQSTDILPARAMSKGSSFALDKLRNLGDLLDDNNNM